MRIFDFFKRRKSAVPEIVSKRESLSRVEFLMYLSHDSAETAHDSWDGLNLPQLAQKHLNEGDVYLAFNNFGVLVSDYFRLAILYWGQGDLDKAESYFAKILTIHEKMVLVASEHELYLWRTTDNKIQWPNRAAEFAKVSAYILNNDEAKFINKENDIGYRPWFVETLIDYCLGDSDFDEAKWQAGQDSWIRKRHPKYILEEYEVYRKSLTGQYGTTKEMLSAHEKMFKGRAKRKNTDSDLLDGYDDNELIIDCIFAVILKRIGWEGRYRHSWPNTDNYDSLPETFKEPDNYLKVIPAPIPEPNPETGIIADKQIARRYIDHNLKEQVYEGDRPMPAERQSKTRSKVSGALRNLGWIKDPASLDLMRTYRMNDVCNETTHIVLCDPVEGYLKLDSWTKFLTEEFNLHPDFIAIAGSEDKSDYLDPQGSWYVYWKKDKQIYAVERDDWHDPVKATKDARLGLTLWPSYTSFVAWWVSEHLKSEFFEDT